MNLCYLLVSGCPIAIEFKDNPDAVIDAIYELRRSGDTFRRIKSADSAVAIDFGTATSFTVTRDIPDGTPTITAFLSNLS